MTLPDNPHAFHVCQDPYCPAAHPDPDGRGPLNLQPRMRMDAYYYGFNETDVEPVDRVLSAVACAGKAFHSTSQWIDDCGGQTYEPFLRGGSPVDWIQNAANDAAAEIRRLRAEVDRLRPVAAAAIAYVNTDLLRVCTAYDDEAAMSSAEEAQRVAKNTLIAEAHIARAKE